MKLALSGTMPALRLCLLKSTLSLRHQPCGVLFRLHICWRGLAASAIVALLVLRVRFKGDSYFPTAADISHPPASYLQEMVPGGELFHHLDLEGAFDEHTSRFYAASVLLSLEFLHSKGFVYRDLKPENLLLDTEGYCKMADFGFAKYVGEDRTYTICGTPDYQVGS